jgi:hypothetical protein
LTAIRRFPLLAALAVVAGLAGAPAAGAAELGFVTDLTWGTSDTDKERTYQALDDLGARWVRVTANWAEIERSQGAYNSWSLNQLDVAVQRNLAAGRDVVVDVYAAPQWASGSTYQDTPPRNADDFARFAGFLAARYRGQGVRGYEIWNEQNISRFWGQRTPSASAYVNLLRAASAAVRAADPQAKVVFGGLSTGDADYVRAAYAAGARGLFDVMAVHPYTCDADITVPANGRKAAFLAYRDIRALQLAQGDAMPMWFTEYGWSTTSGSCGVSEAAQADRLATAARLMAQDPYVEAAMVYNLRNNYWGADADSLEERYGLLTTTWRQKPAYATFKALAAAAPAPAPGTDPVPDPGLPPAPEPTPEPAPEPVPAPEPAPITLKPKKKKHPHARVALVGRVRGEKARRRVAITVRAHGRRHVRKVVRLRDGHFRVALRRLGHGRYRAVARLVARPQVRASRTFRL